MKKYAFILVLFSVSSSAFAQFQTPDCVIMFPNAFSPNINGPNRDERNYDQYQDFDNDIFHPTWHQIEDQFGYELRVYNRRGNLMFQTENIYQGWDGYFQNELCEQGGYLWMVRFVDCNGRQVEQFGEVILMVSEF